MSEKLRGRVTIPTDVDVVPETLELVKRWGADAIRSLSLRICFSGFMTEEVPSVLKCHFIFP